MLAPVNARGALRFRVWWPEGQDARRQRVIRRRSCRVGPGLGLGGPQRCSKPFEKMGYRMISPQKWYVRTCYCGWKKSCTTLDGWNPINNGINWINHLSTGAGFVPSTVGQKWWTNWPLDSGVPYIQSILNSWQTLRELEIAVSFGFEWEDSIQCSKDNRLVSQELGLSRFRVFNDHHLLAILILTSNHVP